MGKFRGVELVVRDGEEASPDEVALERAAKPVAAVYNRALQTLDLKMRHGWVTITLAPPGPGVCPTQDQVLVEVDPRVVAEQAHFPVTVPAGLAGLDPYALALLALDLLDLAARRTVAYTGGDPAPLAAVRERALSDDLSFVAQGPWKASPDRGRRARLVFEVTDAASYGRVEISDGQTSLATPRFEVPESVPSSTHCLRSLWWDGRSRVTWGPFGPGTVDLHDARTMAAYTARRGISVDTVSAHDLVVLRRLLWDFAEIADLGPLLEPTPRPVDAHAARPALREYTPAPPVQAHCIEVSGGGAANYEPLRYTNALWRTLKSLRGTEWQAWWAEAQQGTLRIGWWLGPVFAKRTTYDVRKVRGQWTADISHRADDIPADADHAQLAHDDVTALMEKVRRRHGLGPLPPLPVVELHSIDAEDFHP